MTEPPKIVKIAPLKIGKYLKLFIKYALEKDAISYNWYISGGEKMLSVIIKDIKKEWKMCPRISDFAYEHVLLTLSLWQKELNQLKGNHE